MSSFGSIDPMHARQKQILHDNYETARSDLDRERLVSKQFSERWVESQTELKALKAQHEEQGNRCEHYIRGGCEECGPFPRSQDDNKGDK